MKQTSKILLKPSCILAVPIQAYDNDFTFIVNGEEFKTSRLISDILSPVICRSHLNDPTVDKFIINTHERGDFSQVLQLATFKEITFSDNEIPFISEVIEILGNNSVECDTDTMITLDNVFRYVRLGEKKSIFYRKRLLTAIDFLSKHFYEICETYDEEFSTFSINTLIKILSNDQLRLKSENQLLNFVNNLYKKDSKYSILYGAIFFENVSTKAIREFLSVYNSGDMTQETWSRLCSRLSYEIKKGTKKGAKNNRRYVTKGLFEDYEYDIEEEEEMSDDDFVEFEDDSDGIIFNYSKSRVFKGIINYIIKHSKNESNPNINITASSVSKSVNSDISLDPSNTILYDEPEKVFMSNCQPESWICYDFKKRFVVPTSYTIRTGKGGPNSIKPKSWVIEGSNDKKKWTVLDEQQNSPHLNGSFFVHTYPIKSKNMKMFRYLRMRLTGPNWRNNDSLCIGQIEFYGKLI